MQVTTAQLSQIAALLGTTKKQAVIAATLKFLVDSGIELPTAFDAIFGEGAYKAFAGKVYHALRAKAA